MSNCINWEHIFRHEKALDFYLNVSIPAALKRNESIPHAIIFCDYPRLTEAIGLYISSHIPVNLFFQHEFANTSPNDIAATLTNFPEHSTLLLAPNFSTKRMSPSAIDILQQSIKDGHIEIKIGSGPSARTCFLELPQISFITIVETPNQINPQFKRIFDNVISISNDTRQNFCRIAALAIASENHMCFDADAITEIVASSAGNFRNTAKIVRWIRDYMLVQNNHYDSIPKNYVTKVISLM